ncbi:MAG TPA: PilN domain-containing protein [Candidatus Brocadiia bacterium]|nr:PilN domain-containing protein [Candidatus Brocadiales bacterium]
MAFKTKTTVGLEVTCSKVKLVEIVSSAIGMKITKFAVLDYPQGCMNNANAVELAKKIGESAYHFGGQVKDVIGSLDTKEIYGVVSDPLIEHRIVLLPPMTKQEMYAVTRREASKGGETALLDASFGFDVVGQIDKGGIKKTAVLIVTAPHGLVKEHSRTMEGMGICLRGLTIVPLALFHAIGQCKECGEEDTAAFIYVGIKNACIVMVNNSSLLFSREFSLTPGAEVTTTNYAGRLTAEVKRSCLYFKQHYRGKKVSKGILSGDIQDLRNLASLLAKELDIGVEVFSVTDGLEISLPDEKMSEFQSLIPSLVIPIGLAIAGVRQSKVNLLAQDKIVGKGIWHIDRILKVASIILLLMLLGSYLWMSISNFCTQRTKLTTLKALEYLSPELENINTLQGERQEHATRMLLIETLNAPSPPKADWSEMLREISWLVPDDIVLNKLEAKQEKGFDLSSAEGQRRRITIEGKAGTRNSFNEFLSHLHKASSMAVGAQFIVPDKSGFDKSKASTDLSRTSPYNFVIECEVRE